MLQKRLVRSVDEVEDVDQPNVVRTQTTAQALDLLDVALFAPSDDQVVETAWKIQPLIEDRRGDEYRMDALAKSILEFVTNSVIGFTVHLKDLLWR